jgi:uncharacterized membrane protein YhhN
VSRKILAAFAVVAVAHLVSLAFDLTWLEWPTKALLMPTLAAWVWSWRGPGLLLAGLLLSACGDVALEAAAGGGTLFIVGMAFFASAHVCYVTLFVKRGAIAALKRRWPVPVAYALIWLVLIVVLWPGLGALQLPVAAYSLLLTATAVTSAGIGLRAGLGGALFLLSDALIAMRLAELPVLPWNDLWVMATYIAAQYLLASAQDPRDHEPKSGVVGAPTP